MATTTVREAKAEAQSSKSASVRPHLRAVIWLLCHYPDTSEADERIKTAEAAEAKAATERQRLADETQTASSHLSAQRSELERERQRVDEATRALDAKAEDVAQRERELRRAAAALKDYIDG